MNEKWRIHYLLIIRKLLFTVLTIFLFNFMLFCKSSFGSVAGFIRKTELGYTFSCAIATDNTLYCFGYNTYGQVGKGATSTSETLPVQVMYNDEP